MKLTGILGMGTGKMGNAVMAVVHGTQIVRQYQPVVSNPSTVDQVSSRAKLKLASQLAASVAPYIAIPRKGLVSSRNGFISKNYDKIYYVGDSAEVEVSDIQFTDGSVGLSGFSVDRTATDAIRVEMVEDVSNRFDKIVYVALVKTDSKVYLPFDSVVVSEAGIDGTFPGALKYTAAEITIHAYGISEKSAMARAVFGNLTSPTAESVAKVITSRKVSSTDATLSETRGVYLPVGSTTAETVGVETVLIQLPKQLDNGQATTEAGSVQGGGRYEKGTQATISATANEGYRFVGWKDGTSGNMISTNATYTFTANTNSTIIAVFAELPVLRVNLGIASSSQGVSNVQGGGIKEPGDNVSCSCTVGENINFLGWFDNAAGSGSPVSTANPYSFTMGNESISLWAKGETIGEDGIE